MKTQPPGTIGMNSKIDQLVKLRFFGWRGITKLLTSAIQYTYKNLPLDSTLAQIDGSD